MTSSGPREILFRTGGRYPEAFVLEPTPAATTGMIHHNLTLLGQGSRLLPEERGVFLLLGVAVWATDKACRRQAAPDGWTRELLLSCPGGSLAAQLPALAPLLQFLTGDLWTLRGRPEPVPLPPPATRSSSWQPTAVCLFSGGLDSLVGAIDLIEAGHRCLLVSHYDYGQLAASQKTLVQALQNFYGPEQVQRWGFRVQFEAPELSLRGRSLLFLALGLAAAGVWDRPLPLWVPENGWISLNPPLTGNRLGSYSTRTTHPYFLSSLQALWQAWHINQELHNPYQFLTKGQMLARCRNPQLLRQLLPYTLSCAHPVASRWLKGSSGNCGYCYPCLIRRAALHRIGWDDHRDYLYDVLRQPEVLANRSRGADLRSLLLALREAGEEATLRLLGRTGPVPQELVPRLLAVLEEGQRELRQWLQSGGEFLDLG